MMKTEKNPYHFFLNEDEDEDKKNVKNLADILKNSIEKTINDNDGMKKHHYTMEIENFSNLFLVRKRTKQKGTKIKEIHAKLQQEAADGKVEPFDVPSISLKRNGDGKVIVFSIWKRKKSSEVLN